MYINIHFCIFKDPNRPGPERVFLSANNTDLSISGMIMKTNQVLVQGSGEDIPVTNPANGELVGRIPRSHPEDLERSVQETGAVHSEWEEKDPVDRGKILFHAAGMIRENQSVLATLLTREQGKPLQESRNEISGFARILEYYASVSGSIRGQYSASSAYGHSIVVKKPIGICGAIIPWNLPALIMGWKVAPALVTGNCILVKPATSAPLTCIALGETLLKAGIPDHVLQIITGPGGEIGEAVVTHPGIRSISFTGEVETGKRVAVMAAPFMKHLTLELGGSDAMIVCRDADPDAAAAGAVKGRFFNCGQTCTAVKRLFVDESIAEDMIAHLNARIRKMKIGDGLTRVDMGPLHTDTQRARVISQLNTTIEKDLGRIVTGGSVPGGDKENGYFLEPTLVTDLAPDAPLLKEEVFGPVLPVMTYRTLDEAIEMANSTRYGLGASVWTHDSRTISKVCTEIESGIVWVNQHLKIPPEVPFGGTKSSGIGRENGYYALDHYLEDKTILINP